MATLNKTKDIIEGFEEDFFNIINEYSQSSKDLKIVDFFNYWNENHLDCLFANRFDPRELSEAIIKMNQLLVEVASVSFSFTITQRTVAIYFLLCLFMKQPDRFKRKIRLTCEDAISIQKMASDHQDLRFAWNQLKTKGAIELVEERHLYGPSLLNKRRSKEESGLLSKQSKSDSESAQFLEMKIEPCIEEISTLHQSYASLKDSLKLDEFVDSTVELETKGDLKSFIDEAKSLVNEYKNAINSSRT